MNTKLNSKETLREIMTMAWAFVKRNGYSLSEALATAWRNIKLRIAMKQRIVKFYFQKVDGTIREAFGTLSERLIPATSGEDNRRKNDTVQTIKIALASGASTTPSKRRERTRDRCCAQPAKATTDTPNM